MTLGVWGLRSRYMLCWPLPLPKKSNLLSLAACLSSDDCLYQDTWGVGTPVTLHVMLTSPPPPEIKLTFSGSMFIIWRLSVPRHLGCGDSGGHIASYIDLAPPPETKLTFSGSMFIIWRLSVPRHLGCGDSGHVTCYVDSPPPRKSNLLSLAACLSSDDCLYQDTWGVGTPVTLHVILTSPLPRKPNLLSLAACLSSDDCLYHDTWGVGTPVTLHVILTLSPSLAITWVDVPLLTIFGASIKEMGKDNMKKTSITKLHSQYTNIKNKSSSNSVLAMT